MVKGQRTGSYWPQKFLGGTLEHDIASLPSGSFFKSCSVITKTQTWIDSISVVSDSKVTVTSYESERNECKLKHSTGLVEANNHSAAFQVSIFSQMWCQICNELNQYFFSPMSRAVFIIVGVIFTWLQSTITHWTRILMRSKMNISKQN